MMSTIVCIGSGNMGFALMKGASAGTNIFFTDTDAEKAQDCGGFAWSESYRLQY